MKLGYIGTSDIMIKCLEASLKCPKIERAVLMSRSPEKAKELAIKFNIPCVVSSIEELVQSDVEAVYIASPNALHYPQALYLLQHGKHLLVEKPFTISLEKTREILGLAKTQQKVVLEAVKHIHSPNFTVLQEFLPKIGTIKRAEFNFGKPSSKWQSFQQGEPPNVFSKEMGGGSLMDIGVYCIWLMIASLGMPQKIAHQAEMLHTGVDSCGTLQCTYSSFEAVINHSKIKDIGGSFFIEGEYGTLSGDGLSRMDNIFVTFNGEAKKDISVSQDSNRMVYELQHFVDHIENNTPIPDFYGSKTIELCSDALTLARHSAGIIFNGDN
ncbi:MAG: Gfo/Idh/MocA family protein [Brevinema sp.]